MKYAIIGCGRIANNHIAAAKSIEELDVVAVCDTVMKKCEDLKSKYEIDTAEMFTDYDTMLKEVSPDLVSICTPSGTHFEIAVEAMKKGANVIIEKPMAMSIEEAEKIIETRDETGKKVCVCHQNRFNKAVSRLKRAVDDGDFGRIFHCVANVRWNRNKDYYTQADWRGRWASDGGAIMNQCIHNLDLLCWITGNHPTAISAFTDRLNHPYIEAEDLGIAIIKMENNCYGIMEGTVNVYPKNFEETLCIFGEKGTAKIGGTSLNKICHWEFEKSTFDTESTMEDFSQAPPNIYGFGHYPLMLDMVNAIKENKSPYVTAEDGKRALEAVLAIYKSAKEGSIVTLPLKQCSTIDFMHRFGKVVLSEGELIKLNGNEELLSFIYENSAMGIVTLEQMAGYAQEENFKQHLNDELEQYRNINKEVLELLKKRGIDESGLAAREKVKTYLSVSERTYEDKSTSHLAEVLIVGSNMGITDGIQSVRKYNKAEKEISDLMNKLIHMEEKNVERLKDFL